MVSEGFPKYASKWNILTKGAKLNALESLEIIKLKNKNKLLNDQLDLNNNSPL